MSTVTAVVSILERSVLLRAAAALRAEADRLEAQAGGAVEMTAKEVMASFKWTNYANLTKLVKDNPSVRIRQGVYDARKIMGILNSRNERKRLNKKR